MLTNGLFNGRYWRAVDGTAKVSFIQGVLATLSRVRFRALSGPCDAEAQRVASAYLLPSGFTAGDAEEAIDGFYEDPENRSIATIDALEIVSAKARGVPLDVIENRVSEYRRLAALARERK